jgi:hypothetical protein
MKVYILKGAEMTIAEVIGVLEQYPLDMRGKFEISFEDLENVREENEE